MNFLESFTKIVASLEASQKDLNDLIEIRSSYQKMLNHLSKKTPTPEVQTQIQKISRDLQYANKLIAKCQTAIKLFSQALSSPNPN
jgi:DNA repair ATPase RecN